MKIEIQNLAVAHPISISQDGDVHVIDVDIREATVTFTDVFGGIGVRTEQGFFGIAQRDRGIEVVRDGKLLWSSSDMPDPWHFKLHVLEVVKRLGGDALAKAVEKELTYPGEQ